MMAGNPRESRSLPRRRHSFITPWVVPSQGDKSVQEMQLHKIFKHKRSFGRSAMTALLLTGFALVGHAQTINVSTSAELANAVATANSAGGNRVISIAAGTYTLADTLYVNAPNVTIAGASGDRTTVVIQGDAMSADAKVKNLIRAAGSNFVLKDLTLQKSGWHLLQVVGEVNAEAPRISNVVFRDAWEQMLKVTIDQANYANHSDNGILENSLFEYTAGIGPQYYIGGIDVHGGTNWIVRNNTFKAIASPSNSFAEFAVHFWNHSEDPLVEGNIFVNCDRAIGFGLDSRGNDRGIVRNNMIYHANNGAPFADVAIYLDDSPGTQIYNNTIFTEHSYPRSIEYRFTTTSGVLIVNNLANHPVGSRDGATGTVGSNNESASAGWFVNRAQGNLHLTSAIAGVVDSGRTVAGLTTDIDGVARPQGSGIDIGADEWGGTASKIPKAPTNVSAQ